MSKNKKFLQLVDSFDEQASKKNKERIFNRKSLRASQDIAFKILERLEELGWNQKKLAIELDSSPQYISKLLKGRENLGLQTIIKLQEVLNIGILASYYEQQQPKLVKIKQQVTHALVASVTTTQYDNAVAFKTTYTSFSNYINHAS